MAKKTYIPPQSVRKAASRGLEWRKTYGRGRTQIGVKRAADLSRGAGVSLETIQRMYSYFSRHAVDSQALGWNRGEPGFPSAGRIAWELWGGIPGLRWVVGIRTREGLD